MDQNLHGSAVLTVNAGSSSIKFSLFLLQQVIASLSLRRLR